MPTSRHSELTDRRQMQSRAEQARYLSMLGRWARGEVAIADIGSNTARGEAAERNN